MPPLPPITHPNKHCADVGLYVRQIERYLLLQMEFERYLSLDLDEVGKGITPLSISCFGIVSKILD